MPSHQNDKLETFQFAVNTNLKVSNNNYYTSGTFLTLKFKLQVKSSDPPPPPPHTTLNLAVERIYEKANPQPFC
jgi:hypothetical protein